MPNSNIIDNSTAFITTNSTGFIPNGNAINNTAEDNTYTSNEFLIAIEVVFTAVVIFILMFCFYAGIRKKKKLQRENEKRIENAIYQQEHKFLLHLEGRCHSSSTITTVHQPPPRYTPPNPKYTLPKDAVTRLDCLLSHNQICTKSVVHPPSQCITSPRYTDSSLQSTSSPQLRSHLYY